MSVYRVRIELKRIQTYLFAVPRLRTILGANALIGETLRQRLGAAAADAGAALPATSRVPERLIRWQCGLLADTGEEEPWRTWSADDPKASYEKGILTRDGGHFQALFATEKQVETFLQAAATLVGKYLPGVMTSVQVDCWTVADGQPDLGQGKWVELPWPRAPACLPLFEMPGSKVCEWSGQGEGTRSIEVNKKSPVAWVSPLVEQQWNAGTRFREGRTHDVVGLLQKLQRLPCRGNGWRDAEDLTQLAGGKGRYLALVHIDGNGVGKRTPQQGGGKDQPPSQTFQDWLNHEATVEAFFASMRQQVRLALVETLTATFATAAPGITPYQLLMLGGDDLLLVCQAEFALPFVVHYAQALRAKPLSDRDALDIGAGVAISQPSFPFHALHALAEELASSAKRLSRGCTGHSVVDWMVVTNASVPDLQVHRRQHDHRRYKLTQDGPVEQLIVNARPYFVLADPQRKHPADLHSLQSSHSLQSLLAAADALRAARTGQGGDVARSQLKQLPASLRAGRRAGARAFSVLPTAIRTVLKAHDITQAWSLLGDNSWLSALADLVEVSEIADLGRRVRTAASAGGAADAAARADAQEAVA